MGTNFERVSQGAHPDPLSPDHQPPDPADLSDRWRSALASPEMVAYRQVLAIPGGTDIRQGVLDDLATYHHITPEEALERCLHWEELSVQEWQAGDRSSPEGIRDFYNSTQSWAFDLLWYAYLQAEGCSYPVPVVAAMAFQGSAGTPRCLDFGSGVGDTAQLLVALGYEVDLADVSRPLLDFARWRLARRGQPATFIDLNDEQVPADRYDIILAKDVLSHVPDYAETVDRLHRALLPGGILVANLDTRVPSPENAWHLYEDDAPLLRTLLNTGFVRGEGFDGYLYVFHKVERTGVGHLARRARNAVVLGPAGPTLQRVRRKAGAAVRRAAALTGRS